jgi:hypothetical protein
MPSQFLGMEPQEKAFLMAAVIVTDEEAEKEN